jgi:hypothetical protein
MKCRVHCRALKLIHTSLCHRRICSIVLTMCSPVVTGGLAGLTCATLPAFKPSASAPVSLICSDVTLLLTRYTNNPDQCVHHLVYSKQRFTGLCGRRSSYTCFKVPSEEKPENLTLHNSSSKRSDVKL